MSECPFPSQGTGHDFVTQSQVRQKSIQQLQKQVFIIIIDFLAVDALHTKINNSFILTCPSLQLAFVNKRISTEDASKGNMFKKQLPSAGTGALSSTMVTDKLAAENSLDVSTRLKYAKLKSELDGRGTLLDVDDKGWTDPYTKNEQQPALRGASFTHFIHCASSPTLTLTLTLIPTTILYSSVAATRA